MKKILGLDLGTTSVGWAFVHESEDNDTEESKIIKTGVRVVPLSTDEQTSYERGQSITINADRTDKRQSRRNLFRYKLRRKAVLDVLTNIGFIDAHTPLTETGNDTTFETHRLRALAVTNKVEKAEFARILLAINKKRGYKSSRKANTSEEGSLVDGMAVAKQLEKNNVTPGQYTYQLLQNDVRSLPDYYRSDLQEEFVGIWGFQSAFYPNTLTPLHKKELLEKNRTNTLNYLERTMEIELAEPKGKREEKKLQQYEWRNKAVSEQLPLPVLAYLFVELNNEINQSSGYLNAISDRSKELYFNNETIGQYQYRLLSKDPHTRLKNKVFYRKDYINEFDAIWKEQSKHYPELTEGTKEKLRDITIFYQRRLRSQKGLISICEFEGVERMVQLKSGREKKKLIGPRVAPKSSPVFQEFKIWQNINDLRVSKKYKDSEVFELEEETKRELFEKLNWTGKMTDEQFLKWLFEDREENEKEWKVNFRNIQGNSTRQALFDTYKQIFDVEGYDNIKWNKWDSDKLKTALSDCFDTLGVNKEILEFDIHREGHAFDQQPSYRLWHLLYSYESDNSSTGNESLITKLKENFGFSEGHAKIVSQVTFQQDYGNLSVRAMRKILPHLEDGKEFSEASKLAGYDHSNSLTKEENLNRILADKIVILKKNSLRNPVVEKILNQMIHVVNAIIEDRSLGRPDEIRVELARELKKTAQQRSHMTTAIDRATKKYEILRAKIKSQFGLKYVSRKDLIKYRLYLELEPIGYKSIYMGEYIKPEDLFTNRYDVEHIIPQAKLYDDSFSNKTIERREINIEKGNDTAIDYIQRKLGDQGVQDYKNRVEELWKAKALGFMKKKKLFMDADGIPEGFLNRDIGNTAYISRKAVQLLKEVCYYVTPTSGTITGQLRSDWKLINVLQELNWEKYEKQGLTYTIVNKKGKKVRRIKDWTKRNDHRHHAMDAIAIAFTRPAFIQYLNNLNARGEKDKKGSIVHAIENKYIERNKHNKRVFKRPYKNIRKDAKRHLEEILVSHKAKNKVATINTNRINIKGKGKYKTQVASTPRGQLHKETIYGKSQVYTTKEEKIGSNFDEKKISAVAKPDYRSALLNRLKGFENNPKKAFTGANSLSKNPIYLNGKGAAVPEKVKTVILEDQFTIRKDITPDLKIEKVLDAGVRKILRNRLDSYGGKKKEAFANLDEKPIWQNKAKRIAIKRVTITGVSNAEPLHNAKNNLGQELTNDDGHTVPVDYVSTGSNHHLAVYQNEKGELDDEVVSFYDAVIRKNQKAPIINDFSKNGWPLKFTLKQNELFVFPSSDFNPNEIDLMDKNNKEIISRNLFRVQKFSKLQYVNSFVREYVFRHHLETELKNDKNLKDILFYNVKSLGHLEDIVKVRLNHIGDIVQIGEY